MVIRLKLIHILQGVNHQYKDDHTFWSNTMKTMHPCPLLCKNDELLIKEHFRFSIFDFFILKNTFEPNMLRFITSQNLIISTCVSFLIINMNIILKFESVWCTFDMQKDIWNLKTLSICLCWILFTWNKTLDLHENLAVFFL